MAGFSGGLLTSSITISSCIKGSDWLDASLSCNTKVLTFTSWKRGRSSPAIPAFVAPAEEEDKEGPIDGDGDSHKYDSLSGGAGHLPYGGPSPVYESGGFSIPPVSRQSGTFYEGGRPFGEWTRYREETDSRVADL